MTTVAAEPRPLQAQEMETGPRRLQPGEIEPKYVREPIRYDDRECGQVHTPERAILCGLVRTLGLLSEAELAEATGFSAGVVNDLLDGKRRVPVAVFTGILRCGRCCPRLAWADPSLYGRAATAFRPSRSQAVAEPGDWKLCPRPRIRRGFEGCSMPRR